VKENEMKPEISPHFQNRKPSVIRTAQIEFRDRKDDVEAINVAIGNVSLPMHPAMIRRLADLQAEGSPFQHGAVRYTPTVGRLFATSDLQAVSPPTGYTYRSPTEVPRPWSW
jgi:hypothetical protein